MAEWAVKELYSIEIMTFKILNAIRTYKDLKLNAFWDIGMKKIWAFSIIQRQKRKLRLSGFFPCQPRPLLVVLALVFRNFLLISECDLLCDLIYDKKGKVMVQENSKHSTKFPKWETVSLYHLNTCLQFGNSSTWITLDIYFLLGKISYF